MSWRLERDMASPRRLLEDETWTQTLLTITPEDDAVLREIKPSVLVSARAVALLNLHTDSFAYRRPLTPKYLVEPEELEGTITKHVETQTYLQGIPIVNIPLRYKDEASQTVYMSSPCPPVKQYEDVMTSMKDGPIPEMKNTRQTQTLLTLDLNVKSAVVAEQLTLDVTKEEIRNLGYLWNEKVYPAVVSDAVATDVFYYIEDRVFWILDPTSIIHQPKNENYTQTVLRFNELTNSIVADNETQTLLTCEPKNSNSGLLTDYEASDTKKNVIKKMIEECFDKAAESMGPVDDIVNEIVEKSAERVKLPSKDQDIQTLASYDKNENRADVLRKLQLPLIVDPLESSIVVLPLMDDLLESVCETVSNDANRISKDLLENSLNKSMFIISKIDDMRRQFSGKPIEQILDQRKAKIAKLMEKTKTETVSTQTSIFGINEIKLDAPKETFSCFCLKHSRCHVCLSTKVDKIPEREMKMLRTKDILLAYKPCQVVSSPFGMEFDGISPKSIEERLERAAVIPSSDGSGSDSTATFDIVLKHKERVKLKESIDEWSRAIDTALKIPWSPKSSLSNEDKLEKYSNDDITLQTEKVFEILKSTFCIRDTCPMSVVDKLRDSSYEEMVNDRTKSTRKLCPCSGDQSLCIGKKNFQDDDDDSISETETYNASFDNRECLCHISYTLDSWHQPRAKNDACKVKIIPVQFTPST